jgi:hypothetical protein
MILHQLETKLGGFEIRRCACNVCLVVVVYFELHADAKQKGVVVSDSLVSRKGIHVRFTQGARKRKPLSCCIHFCNSRTNVGSL